MRGARVLTAFVVLAAGQAPAVGTSVDARSLQPGELVALTIVVPATAGAVHVRAFDRDWPAHPVNDRTWRAILGIDLDVTPGSYDVAVRVDSPAGVARGRETLVVATKTFTTRQLKVDDAFVNPPADVQPRIEREAAELTTLWATNGPPRWTAAFVAPVADPANSAFGSRSIFNGQPRSPHSGADFASPAGTPVKAPAAGRVMLARDLYFTGQTVMIDHGAGVISLFAHLSAINVALDADVVAGQTIGQVGATGRVTGAHLHWAVRASGARVDPLSVLHVLGARR